MTSRTVSIVAVIAVVAGLGGGATVLSLVRAQQPPSQTVPEDPHDHDHDHEDGDDGKTDPHEDEPNAAGHRDDEHEGVDGDDQHADHDDHGEEPSVQLSGKERRRFGINVALAGTDKLTTQIRLPGQIALNADRVAHIVPRAPGIVREVLKSVGDRVQAGEIMAWLESAELGEAKVDYLAKWAALGCSTVDLIRAQEVHDNTTQLLDVLNSSPSLETLREMNGGAMGENRSFLISAYAELVFAKAAYLRERPLFEKKIASERDYQAAEAEYKKADALYAATRDSVGFKVKRDLLESKRAQQVRTIELKGARRHLYVLGLKSKEIAELELLTQLQTPPAAQKSECKDPNCKDCKRAAANKNKAPSDADIHEAEEKLAWYPLRAPFDGTVIDKHLTLGEKHSDESGAFTVADLASVWVNIAVYQKDLPYVKEGVRTTVFVGDDMPSAEGTITYVAPVVDEKTRTALARLVLPNVDGQWRPGLFVNAEITIGQEGVSVVVPKSAVQRLDGESVVFLDTAEGFRPTTVSIGRSNGTHVEVLTGLAVGQRYVIQGAFELKAKIVTSGLDAHAGHGH